MLQQRLIDDDLCQQQHLRLSELGGGETRNRLGLERLLAALVVVGKPAKDSEAMHAAGQRQIGSLHAGVGYFDSTQAHDFECGMVKLAGADLLVGRHAAVQRKCLYFRRTW